VYLQQLGNCGIIVVGRHGLQSWSITPRDIIMPWTTHQQKASWPPPKLSFELSYLNHSRQRRASCFSCCTKRGSAKSHEAQGLNRLLWRSNSGVNHKRYVLQGRCGKKIETSSSTRPKEHTRQQNNPSTARISLVKRGETGRLDPGQDCGRLDGPSKVPAAYCSTGRTQSELGDGMLHFCPVSPSHLSCFSLS